MAAQKQATRYFVPTEERYPIISLLFLLVIVVSAVPVIRLKLIGSPLIALLYWGAVILLIKFYFKSIHTPGRFSEHAMVKGYAITGALVFIGVNFIVGVFTEALKASPYDLSPAGMLTNVVTLFSALFAREMMRAYLIGTAWRCLKRRYAAIVFLTVLMALSTLNLSKMLSIKNLEELVIFLSTDLGIAFANSIIASVLAFYGGAAASIFYLGIIDGFYKVFPFIPELIWLAKGAIGISFPIIYSMMVLEKCKTLAAEKRMEQQKSEFAFLFMLFVSVMLSWFSVGVFPVYPSIILTGSMEPEIRPGDIVLIQKMQEEEQIYALQKGDIINFDREDITITHRIEEVIEDEAGNRSFRTKGDNNKSADEQVVDPNDVNGIVVNVVPKIGTPIVAIKKMDAVPTGVVDDE